MHADIISVDADSKLTVKRLLDSLNLNEAEHAPGVAFVLDAREGAADGQALSYNFSANILCN